MVDLCLMFGRRLVEFRLVCGWSLFVAVDVWLVWLMYGCYIIDVWLMGVGSNACVDNVRLLYG